VQSPRHPERYPHNLDCTWKIGAPMGYALRLKFHAIAIENYGNCNYDYLEVTHLSSLGEVLRCVSARSRVSGSQRGHQGRKEWEEGLECEGEVITGVVFKYQGKNLRCESVFKKS